MGITVVGGKKMLGLKLFSKRTGALYASLWAGSVGSIGTIATYGRALNLYDKGIEDPVSLLAGSVIGRE